MNRPDFEWADLYHDYRGQPPDFALQAATARMAMGRGGPDAWRQNYFDRIIDLVTRYEPDLLSSVHEQGGQALRLLHGLAGT